MASRRFRSRSSLNSNIADINSKISEISKRPYITGLAENSVTNVAITDETIVAENLAEYSVTNEKIAPQAISKSKLAADVYNEVTLSGYTSTPQLFLEVPLSEEDIISGLPSPVPTGRIYGEYYPVGVDANSLFIQGNSTSSRTVNVLFTSGVFLPFESDPVVTVTSKNPSFVASVDNTTTTGTDITIRRIDNAIFTSFVAVNYIAMQMPL